jgi:hypothetical protein
MTLRKSHIFCLLLSAALLFPGCRKDPMPSSSSLPIFFAAPEVAGETKALHTAMGATYNTGESFVAFAAYSTSSFDPSAPGSYIPYWDTHGLKCSYNSTFHAWTPTGNYYWPMVGYLSFQAYSPWDAAVPSFDWQSGFTFANFTVPDAGNQYDLMYTDLVANCQSSDYTIKDGNAYDDEHDYEYAYNGVNLRFHHTLSQVEVQASSGLGSSSPIKYYVQKVVLKNAYNTGTFTSNNGAWNVNEGVKTDYTILDLSGESDPEDRWKVLPGADEYPESINTNLTLMLLPQTLNRASDPDFKEDTDAYLEITYKSSTNPSPDPVKLPLTDIWEKGKKYTYQLVFSDNIEFSAQITKWDDEITTGYYVIVQ